MKDREKRTSDYVCIECGDKYRSESQKKIGYITTFHTGECGICGEFKSITHMRLFNYLYIKVNE